MKSPCILLFLILIILCSCNNSSQRKIESIYYEEETITIPYQYHADDSIKINLENYEVCNKILPLLDSIIDSMQDCPRFNASKKAFSFSTFHANNLSGFWISTVDLKFYNPINDDGVFFYKEYRFYCDGKPLNSFLKRTGQYTSYDGVKLDKYMIDRDDRELSWRYLLKNNKLICIGYNNCSHWWHHEEYQDMFYTEKVD